MFGYTEQEFRSLKPWGLLDVADPRFSEALKERQHTGLINGRELTAIHKNGSTFIVEVDSFILSDDPSKSFLVLRYVTELNRIENTLRESEEMKRATLNALPAHIAVVDKNGNIIAVNRSWVDFAIKNNAGGSPTVAVGANYFEVCKLAVQENDEYAVKAIAGIKNVLEKKIPLFSFEYPCHSPTEQRWFLMHVIPLTDSLDGAVITHLNITDRKKAEQSLQKVNEELKRSNMELERFAYIVSHELHEPLRAISGFVRLLDEWYKDKLDEMAAKYMYYINHGVLRMDELLSSLLDYSRVDTIGGVPSEISVEEALKDAIANLNRCITEANANITYDKLPMVTANGTQLTQLFQNLIHNSIKFRGEKKACVHIGCRKEANNWVFWVKDNGIGIKSEQFERIFEIFQRLNTPEQYPGSGIGLSICKKIVERHGGKIWVESEIHKGTTFYFSLPDK